MKTTAVRYFKRPIWVIIVNDGTIVKLNPPEELAGSTDPIVVALLQWNRVDGASGHYQSMSPQPCTGCAQTWASLKCKNCPQPRCQSCHCNCGSSADVGLEQTHHDEEMVESYHNQGFIQVQVTGFHFQLFNRGGGHSQHSTIQRLSLITVLR